METSRNSRAFALLHNYHIRRTDWTSSYNALINRLRINGTDNIASVGTNLAEIYQDTSRWQNLTNKECIQAYGQDFISARSDVLAITSDLNASHPLKSVSARASIAEATDSLGFRDSSGSQYWWLCSGSNHSSCDLDSLSEYSAIWNISDSVVWGISGLGPPYGSHLRIKHCLSKTNEEHCRVQLSLIILCIVVSCNFLKKLCMSLLLRHQTSPPLVTIGDAVESFLQDRDPTTENMCLADKYDNYTFGARHWDDSTRSYLKKSHRWFSSASWRHWLTCNLLCISALLVAGSFLFIGLGNPALETIKLSHLWKLGFGAITSESLVSWNMPGSGGLLLSVLVIDFPQALISFLFLTYNSLNTCMLMASEWSDYAYERKPLRVTNPIGDQRSTYRLQLPYKYGIPFTFLSMTLHWLVSQSLFLARAAAFSPDGIGDTEASISTMRYSCVGLITVIGRRKTLMLLLCPCYGVL